MVLLLTDGLPQSIEGDSSQNPCFLGPYDPLVRGFGTDKRVDGQDIALKVVAVGQIDNKGPFLCFPTRDFIEVGDIVDVPEYTTEVNNEFFAEFCRVLTYGCNIPLYPHFEGSTEPLYNSSLTDLSMNSDNVGFLYTFKVREKYTSKDKSVYIWPHEASIKAESNCTRDNITLSAKLWKWQNNTYRSPKPYVSKNKAKVENYPIDKDGDTYNWYNFSFPTNPDSKLGRGDYYTLEIIIEDFGECNYDDLRFQVQSPFITPGTVYKTEYFDDVWFKFNDNDDDDDHEWYPNLISSPDLPDDFDQDWPFVTFCINEFAVPATPFPTESPTPEPTGLMYYLL